MHHIGMIARDLEKWLDLYQKLGYQVISEPLIDPVQQNQLVFIQNPESREVLELIKPLNENSSVAKSKDGYHHLCYEITNYPEFIEGFKSKKIGKIFTDKICAPAFQGKNVVFVYLKNGALIELLEVN